MKALFTLLAILTLASGYSQDRDIKQALQPFNKVVVSHRIDLVLIPGNTESIRIEYSGVDAEKIIIDQRGHKVHVYLENAKFFDIGERRHNSWDRRERYPFAKVTAYVTFKDLSLIEIRGEGDVTCDGDIISKKLKVRAYGETDIRLAYVEAGKVKARLFGENSVKILNGDAGHLSYKMFGENQIDSRGMTSITSTARAFGEARVSLHSSEEVRVSAFGEQIVYVSGSPFISKGIILGHTNIRRN
jgi:hypothetical protein